jgi:uncharacterized protein (TIGR02145 family)
MKQSEENTLFANRYQLIERLGIGGYSEVWKAEDTLAGNMLVAIKIFAPDKGLDKSGLELFGKEYTLVFDLNHPNLLKPMHYDVFKDSPYLVLQYCSKGSLYQKIGKLAENEIAAFIKQTASALAYLHQQETPIIHQDIKPDNFLIDNNGNYLLADFGISSKIRRTLTRSMGEKASTGTMAYMPPEKFNEDRQAIKAGDIFSLGVCMFELLTGELAFGDLGGLALKSGADLPKLPDSFSKELNSIIRCCLAKDPWDRPTAESLVEIAKSYELNGKWDISKLPIVKQKIVEEPIIIPKEPEKPKARETVQIPVNKVETEKKKPIAKPPFDSFGKPILYIGIAIALFFTIIYFVINKAPSAEEIAANEQRIQDSIAQVEQERINESYEAAEQAINDSINLANNNATTSEEMAKTESKSNYGSFIDSRDGKTYKTIKIGNQIWMAENLAYTGNNGYQRQITDDDEWNNSSYDGWCYYDNNKALGSKYGVLYQWEAAKKARPDGWHLPTDGEWKDLIDYLGGKAQVGGKLKEAGFTHWKTPNTGATNSTSFSALPGGYRYYGGAYYSIRNFGGWWCSTEYSATNAWYSGVYNDDSDVNRSYSYKSGGFYVRCIED